MYKYVNGKRINLTEAEVLARQNEASIEEQERLNSEYARLRQIEYPPLGEQFDMMYHDQTDGTTTWYDTIAAIKAKYPKPEGV